MSKPSIFSQNYSDSMRKRRRKIIFSVLVALIIVCGGAFYISKKTTIKDVRENVKKIASSLKGEGIKAEENQTKKKEDLEKKEAVKEGKAKESDAGSNEAAVNDKIGRDIPEEKNERVLKDKKRPKDQKEHVGLGGETMATINYKVKDGIKEIISLDKNDKITWDILNNTVVVNIKESFNTYIIMSDFSVKNVTMKEYISTKKKSYTKEYVSERYKGYVWAEEPRFLDDNTIVYKSYLPFINDKKLQYIWIYNIKEETHQKIFHQMPNSSSVVFGGTEVIIGKVEGENINITVDGYNFLLDGDGKVTKKQ